MVFIRGRRRPGHLPPVVYTAHSQNDCSCCFVVVVDVACLLCLVFVDVLGDLLRLILGPLIKGRREEGREINRSKARNEQTLTMHHHIRGEPQHRVCFAKMTIPNACIVCPTVSFQFESRLGLMDVVDQPVPHSFRRRQIKITFQSLLYCPQRLVAQCSQGSGGPVCCLNHVLCGYINVLGWSMDWFL